LDRSREDSNVSRFRSKPVETTLAEIPSAPRPRHPWRLELFRRHQDFGVLFSGRGDGFVHGKRGPGLGNACSQARGHQQNYGPPTTAHPWYLTCGWVLYQQNSHNVTRERPSAGPAAKITRAVLHRRAFSLCCPPSRLAEPLRLRLIFEFSCNEKNQNRRRRVGNCFSSLLQGINFYGDTSRNGSSDVGLMHRRIGPYEPQDIEVVAAFDIDRRKVGLDAAEAIFARPNCTKVFCKNLKPTGAIVMMAASSTASPST